MDAIAFTSQAACDRIAERAVRTMSNGVDKTAEVVRKLITPVVSQLSDRGKMRRGSLKTLCSTILAELRADGMVAMSDMQTIYGSLSTKETYHVKFVMAVGDKDEQWLEFYACEFVLSRREAVVKVVSTDFKVHKHVLSRFMLRERAPITEFLKRVREPLIVAPIMAAKTCHLTSQHFAVPIGSGMMMGRCVVERPHPHAMMTCHVDSNGAVTSYRGPRETPSLVAKATLSVELLTYVDHDGMTAHRENLHRMLSKLSKQNDAGLQFLFDRTCFEMATVSYADYEATLDNCHRAMTEAKAVADSTEWEFFTQTVG